MRKRAALPPVSPQDLPDPTQLTIPIAERPNRTEVVRLQYKTIIARAMGAGAGKERAVQYLLTVVNEEAARSGEAVVLEPRDADRLYYEVLREWENDYRAESAYFRASQVKRLQLDLATMRAERQQKDLPTYKQRATWNDILRTERELARITGTYAPVNVNVLDVNEVMKDALTEVIGGLSGPEIDDIIAEGYAVEEKAEF